MIVYDTSCSNARETQNHDPKLNAFESGSRISLFDSLFYICRYSLFLLCVCLFGWLVGWLLIGVVVVF